MSSEASQPSAMLEAWREQGADRIDPVRFRFIEAMALRAAGHHGEARRVLEDKLSELVTAYAEAISGAVSASTSGHTANETVRQESVRTALKDLTDYLAGQQRARGDGPANGSGSPRPSTYPELPLLDDFREIWSKLSTQRQLKQSRAQVPGNAGPLNSSSLVHRSLSLMQALSPGYLQQFLSYVDALSWMEQMHASAPADKPAPRSGKPRRKA